MIIISPSTPARIVESYLVENLNPSTDSRLLNPDGTVRQWVRSGRAMWDYIAGDRDNPIMWVDLVAAMGWEYYLADAGFADRWGGEQAVRKAIRYAASKMSVLSAGRIRATMTPTKKPPPRCAVMLNGD